MINPFEAALTGRLSRIKSGTDGNNYSAPKRKTIVITTTSIANGATWTGTVNISPAYRLYAIETSKACRTRLYIDIGSLTSDAPRAIGTDPDDGAGCILEFVSEVGLLSAALSPLVDGYNSDGGSSVNVSITNKGTSGICTVTLTYIKTEV